MNQQEAKARMQEDDAALTNLETAVQNERMGLAGALARAYLLGIDRGGITGVANGDDTKRQDKIRDAFQANYRAALNMLSSMTVNERDTVLLARPSARPDEWARRTARAACVETWGSEAVSAALGGS